MSAAAVIALRRKKFIRRFAERGATSSDKAILFADLQMRPSWIFEQMVTRGVFVRLENNRYYMNEQSAQAFLAAQRRRALAIASVSLLVFLIVLLALIRW